MNFKKALAVLLFMLAIVSLVACDTDKPVEKPAYYTVTLNYNNGTELHTVEVAANTVLSAPKDPEKEGYIFGGWKNGARDWDFNGAVMSDMTLTASWIDASSLFDYVTYEDGIKVVEYTGALSAIRVPSVISGYNVTAIADGVFSGLADSVSEITLPETVSVIGEECFFETSGVAISVGGAISYLGESAFAGCNGLSKIVLTEGLKTIPFSTFAGCSSLKTVTIPESVSSIEENAFYGAGLQTLVILSHELTVENGAFSDCDALMTVFFLGSEDQWQTLLSSVDTGGGENDDLLGARICFYSEDEPDAEGDFWYYNESGEPRVW